MTKWIPFSVRLFLFLLCYCCCWLYAFKKLNKWKYIDGPTFISATFSQVTNKIPLFFISSVKMYFLFWFLSWGNDMRIEQYNQCEIYLDVSNCLDISFSIAMNFNCQFKWFLSQWQWFSMAQCRDLTSLMISFYHFKLYGFFLSRLHLIDYLKNTSKCFHGGRSFLRKIISRFFFPKFFSRKLKWIFFCWMIIFVIL